MKKNLLISIVTTSIILLAASLYLDVLKFPVKNDKSGVYYEGLFFVYVYDAQCTSCGFLKSHIPLLRYKNIPFSNPFSFEIVYQDEDPKDTVSKDKFHVYAGGEPAYHGSPSTLKAYDTYAKDENNIYYKGNVMTTLDPETFEAKGYFIEDKNSVYTLDTIPPHKVELIDRETLVSTGYDTTTRYIAYDKNLLYAFDPDSGGYYVSEARNNEIIFTRLGCNYYLISGKIYYKYNEVKNADIASFKLPLSANTDNIESCGGKNYAFDKNNKYYQGKPISDIDDPEERTMRMTEINGLELIAKHKN